MPQQAKAKGWVGVDLDGTLAKDTGWKGIDHIGEPIPAMVDRVKQWLEDGKEVRILTARVSDNRKAAVPIKAWCKKHIGRELEVTCEKDPDMEEIWDDKAVEVEHNKGTQAEALAMQMLDLTEDLESKMPHLLRQFADIGERVIRQIADIDPTTQKAYITWLLHRYRVEPEAIPIDNPAELRDALHLFDQKKNRHGFVGQRDIMAFKTVAEFLEAVEANRTDGMEVINHRGAYKLYNVTTGRAARKLAIGLGRSFNQKQTTWCTVAEETAEGYIADGPLLVVTNGNDSYVQAHFPTDAGSSQVRNAHNSEISEAVGIEIAPVCNVPIVHAAFKARGLVFKPSGWMIDPDKMEKALEDYRKAFFSERWEGFDANCKKCGTTGRVDGQECEDCGGEGIIHFGPYTNAACLQCHGTREVDGENCPACVEVIEQRWLRRRPLFLEIFNRAIEEDNQKVLFRIATKHPEPRGIQALFNGIYLLAHPEMKQPHHA